MAAAGDLPVLVHAEAPGPLEAAPAPEGRSYPAYLASRPDEAEVVALEMVVEALRRTGGRAHILHLSSAQGLEVIDRARHEGLRISVETCPHYLSLAAEDIPDGATQTKCAPPVRGRANRELLWDALGSGQIDFVASDHSPGPAVGQGARHRRLRRGLGRHRRASRPRCRSSGPRPGRAATA